MNFNPKRALSIAKKEIHHVLRDPFTLALALGLPVLLVSFFGFVINFDIKEIRTAVYDRDRSRASRQWVEQFTSSQYFKPQNLSRKINPLRAIESEQASVSLIVEPGFSQDLGANKSVQVQILLDGADNSTAGIVLSYLANIRERAAAKLQPNMPKAKGIELETRFLFNPELNSRWFVIPGLLVVVLNILSVLLTALTVAREWETGSMELLLTTPVRPTEIILGKLAPYILLGLFSVLFVYGMARIVFHVPFVGNYLTFGLACLMFLGTTLAQGLLISVITRQQQLAMQMAIISGLLPSLLLSGFIFSIENMPIFFQYFTSILPAKWFMIILRGIFLRGATITELGKPFFALFILNTFLIFIANRRFKKDLEP